jgi:hypothetical protein
MGNAGKLPRTLLVFLLGIVCAAFLLSSSSTASAGLGTQQAQAFYPPGIPAIQPTKPGIPAYTVEDVRQYVLTYGFPGGKPLSGGPPVILAIQFITAQEASILMRGESADRPDTALVCYVLVKGPFDANGKHEPEPSKAGSFAEGEMVFDAQTGNLLVWGGHA